MDILEYAKSHFFIKMLSRGKLWEIYMQSMLNKDGDFVNIKGERTPYGNYIVYIRKAEGYHK